MTTTKMKSLCLRRHEVRALLRCGRVLAVRVVKLSDENTRGCGPGLALLKGDRATYLRDGIGLTWMPFGGSPEIPMPPDKVAEYSPFGKVGGRLAGKEAWARRDDFDWKAERKKTLRYLHYEASYEGDLGMEWHYYGKWRSAATMPAWCSRLTVEVAAVQCKRVQAITEDEAKAAGIESNAEGQWKHYLKPKYGPSPIHSFETLWRLLHGPDAWASNPWVWIGDLRRCD